MSAAATLKRGGRAKRGAGPSSGLDFLKSRVQKAKEEEADYLIKTTQSGEGNFFRFEGEEVATVFRTKAELQKESVEAAAKARIQEREKKEVEEKERLEAVTEFYKERGGAFVVKASPSSPDGDDSQAAENPDELEEPDLDNDDAIPVSLALYEIICRLRRLAEPITYFGETQMQRLRRLKEKEQENIATHELRSTRGQNVFQQEYKDAQSKEHLIAYSSPGTPFGENEDGDASSDSDENRTAKDVDRRVADMVSPDKNGRSSKKRRSSGFAEGHETGGSTSSNAKSKKTEAAQRHQDEQRAGRAEADRAGLTDLLLPIPAAAVLEKNSTKNNYEQENHYESEDEDENSDEKLLRKWIKKYTKTWEQALANRTEDERSSPDGKVQLALFRQSKKDMQPLLKRLKKHDVERETLKLLTEMRKLCERRDYRLASERYIELTVGNAAWPVGVTSVGIHERVGRSKISSSNIANTLNDDTTRKCMQVWKRLMKQCQNQNPPDDSSNVM